MNVGDVYYEKHTVTEISHRTNTVSETQVERVNAIPQKWVPVTTRPMTEEEKEIHREQLEYVDDAVIFNCPLPDDGQEVLITVYGETELDTFYNDAIDGCYFENRNIEDVRAWMPLPKPYQPQESEDKE